MAAGLGFKDFVTGEVLTAADVDGYLMQNIWVFASTAARDAAVTAPAEGNFAFTKDTDSLWYYNGAAWVSSGATGDIEGVTAGIGISGGGTSGTVTVTNSMATAIDAKGDLVVGTGADTFSRLAAGTNTYVLTADSAEATGLKWAAPASGATFVGCSIYKTTNQSIANDTDEVITFGSEEFDTDAFHSTSTNTSRITIPAGKGGKYLIVGQASWAASATGQRRLMVFLNGSSISMGIMANPLTVSGQPTRYNMSLIKELVATDYIELAAFQTSGGALDIQGIQSVTRFGVVYLGA